MHAAKRRQRAVRCHQVVGQVAGVAAGGSCPTVPTVPNTGFIWYGPGIGQVTGSPHPVSVKITFLFQPWVPVVRDASGNGVTFSAQTTMETEY